MAPSISSKRIRNISVSRPIIYGNIAEKVSEKNPLPASSPSDHTHTWKVFLADPLGNDLSQYIKKVVFKLHDTYVNSSRSIESPPFEVHETGWGEFEIVIKIYFQNDCGEKNITLYHHLKLHPYPTHADIQRAGGDEEAALRIAAAENVSGHVESIQYDELVFNEPTERMFKLLTQKPGSLLPYKSDKTPFTKVAEREELDRIDKAMEEINKLVEQRQIEFKKLEEERKKIVQL
ncbi:unnamed protein product [Ambrosiozyma monospora]|uniref:Protein AF-9 homolog n=1 Tax=Ambrosiozyma monospora TaxID=43982 RepID=A0A9W6YQN0_AMBMO|nr:unnamed protein product [Ambrosiozyma monospora]